MWDVSCTLDRSIYIYIQSRQSTLHGGSVAISFETVIQYIHETLHTNNAICFGSILIDTCESLETVCTCA